MGIDGIDKDVAMDVGSDITGAGDLASSYK